jgi:ubiquinone/menaquinone biosynthesis C-methylase UbiE
MGTGQELRRIALGAYRRVNRDSFAGLPWKRQGDFITFDWSGFVFAPSIPLLFARHHYEIEVIRRLLEGKKMEKSLEFGCGFGRLSPTLASLATEHTAIDINPDALREARDAYPHIRFLQSEGVPLPFPDDSFDVVLTWTVLQHVKPQQIDDVLVDIKRVLAPGGRLLLCEETRSAGAESQHCWHREPSFYEERLLPLRMTYSSYIEELDRLPGVGSPGRVMLFEP